MVKFEAPFIFKVKFYNPVGKNPDKNAAHIQYIGTRPGADIGELEIKEEEEINLDDLDSPAAHVKYAHERPGSHGLFTSDDEIPNLKEIQMELKQHRGIVWRMVLSLKEEDAARLDFLDRHKWENALRASVPEAARKMGIGPSNLRWVGAFHQEQGHPHVHLVIWEKKPERTKGLLSKGERVDVKKVFMREIYAEERTRLLQEKTAMRDLIRDVAKGDTERAVFLVQEVRKEMADVELELQAAGAAKVRIAPKMYNDDVKHYAKQLDYLARQMPGKGRAALQYMPPDVKLEARKIADQLINQSSFKESLDRYMKSVEEMTELHTNNSDTIQKAKENAYNDLRDRVANIIVRGAAQINRMDQENEFQMRASVVQRASVAKGVWKSVWQAIEQVRMQSEAQTEIQKRQAQAQLKRQIQQEKEQER